MDKNINAQTKRYKPSKYNFFFRAEDGSHLAYNAITGGFAKIDNEKFPVIYKTLQAEDIMSDAVLSQEVWNKLVEGGFIIESEIDEIDLLKVKNRMERFNANQSLSLTILPTFACNFQCIYCYEVKRNESMDWDLQTRLVKLVEGGGDILRFLHITWMGGEPLLGLRTIEFLSSKFLDI